MLRMLTRPSNALASMDGLRASLLEKAFAANKSVDPQGNFVVIGHPKAVTPYSLQKLDHFLHGVSQRGEDQVTVFSSYAGEYLS